MSSRIRTSATLALALAFAAGGVAEARPMRNVTSAARVAPPSQHVAFMGYLHDGRTATVYTDGRITIVAPRAPRASGARRSARDLLAARTRRPRALVVSTARYGPLSTGTPARVRGQILSDIEHPQPPFVPGRVLVAFRNGVTIAQDHDALAPATAAAMRTAVAAKRRDFTPHPFTNDGRTNALLLQLGVDRADRLLSHVDRGTLGALRGRAEARSRKSLVPIENAFALHVSTAAVPAAVRRLRALPGVAYAAPDFTVVPMIAGRRPLPATVTTELAGYRRAPRTFGRSIASAPASAPALPGNSAISFDLQAMLNAPGVDAVAPFDEIGRRFNQLPGAGEIVTNIGLGDVTDASAGTNPNDPCHDSVAYDGPTTHLVGGQHYLDLPGLPLIPAYVSDADGNLSPTANICGIDSSLAEVGLDFSVMAPLPDAAQRPGEVAPFAQDLLGIAPGATYRWVAPGGAAGTSDILAAFIGAARQQPAPNVITASLGFGADSYGFPSRYFEDDPLVESVVAGIVASNVVVCIAANDGTRDFTTAAIGPSGGSAATNAGSANFTSVDDLYYSSAPSVDPDSGAIDVGASTLDDIIAANPQDPALASLANTKAFAETRYDGAVGFSSGFGSRVNVSAPGDNIEALFLSGPRYDAAGTEIAGGTSASAPEVAAAAAVALQVARLTGHPFASATQVRDLLAATGTPVANPPQSDVVLNVGPQVSVRRAVESLLAAGGQPVQPGVARVAVQGRRSGSLIAQYNEPDFNDGTFVTALDPSYIKLDGPYAQTIAQNQVAFPGSDTAADLNSYITLAPDWEGIPANATYRLAVAGNTGHTIATTPYARLLPAQLFALAGVALTPGSSRTLNLTYTASVGLHAVAQTTFQLTFGPPSAHSRLVLAPKVPPVVSGTTIPVTYDVRGYPPELLGAARLVVSLPGAANTQLPSVGLFPYYSVALPSPNGTVSVPVSALGGAGTYAIWIALNAPATAFPGDVSDLGFTRVDAGSARPPAPLLALAAGAGGAHQLDVPYGTPFRVTYDVSNVPGATGAIVEIAAPAPGYHFAGAFAGLNLFRNPNGNAIDDDGAITGSVYHTAASGTSGTVTIDPTVARIPATATVNVRVLPAAGGSPIAEASDDDTLEYHGVDDVFGTELEFAYLNPAGSDGILVEGGSFGSAQANTGLFNVEPFDLAAGAAVSGIPLSITNSGVTFSPIVQTDDELVSDSIDFQRADLYRASPISAGYTSFAFPAGSFSAETLPFTVAANSSPARSAYAGLDLSSFAFVATRGDLNAGANFTSPITVDALNDPNNDPYAVTTFGYDPSADRSYVLDVDATVPCEQRALQFATIDYTTGTAATRTLSVRGGFSEHDNGGFGAGYQMAVDPGTHVAALATSCTDGVDSSGAYEYRAELTLIDLSTGATTPVFTHRVGAENIYHGGGGLLGGDSATIGIDPVNHLVLETSLFCPSFIQPYDVNARPCLNEYDETGRLVKTVPGLFADGPASNTFAGVNGTTRTGLTPGSEALTPYVYSTAVQPFTY